jgi:hypothetical protein
VVFSFDDAFFDQRYVGERLGVYAFPIRGDGGVEFHKTGEWIVWEFLVDVGVVVELRGPIRFLERCQVRVTVYVSLDFRSPLWCLIP